ncbi:MAG: hypothetical protein JOY67_04690 [Hyphomicrobiales bacterium]|nr:hypothetical protein [Hyphomicrobiales bacterium]
MRIELEHCLRIGLVRNPDLRVRNAVELQYLQLTVVDFYDRRKRVGASTTLDRNEDLLRGLMHSHVVNDDLVLRRTEKPGQLLIDALDEVPPFEVVKIAELHIRLRCQIGPSERESVNGRAFDITDEKNVVRAEGERTRGSERTGAASAGHSAISRCGGAAGQSQSNGRGRGKSQYVPPWMRAG